MLCLSDHRKWLSKTKARFPKQPLLAVAGTGKERGIWETCFFHSVTGARKKTSECFSQKSALWPSVISLDALPLSYGKLVGVKITNLGSCNKHLCTYCFDWNIDLCLCGMIEIRWWILSLVNTWERCFFQSVSDTDGSEEKIRILPLGAKPLTFWLLLQALYHKATGDSWKLSPFFPPFLSLSLYQLRQ